MHVPALPKFPDIHLHIGKQRIGDLDFLFWYIWFLQSTIRYILINIGYITELSKGHQKNKNIVATDSNLWEQI